MRAKRPVPCACGSYQIDDSIGSSVKETNSEISTAAETMMPNWKKKRPMMPPMKATGRNTATMQKVVASTASPISLVPSSAAWRCVLPKPMWRMMFSRTTMASSIRMPMARLSAISVSTFSVKPNAAITMKAPNTEIGSVRPVITVLRQECRNRNTMAMVSRPPSIIVCCTLLTEFWMPRELSRTISSLTSGGSDGLQFGHGLAHAARHLDGVGALRLDDVDGERALAVQDGDVLALLLAVDDGRDLAQIDRGGAAAGDDQVGEVARARRCGR